MSVFFSFSGSRATKEVFDHLKDVLRQFEKEAGVKDVPTEEGSRDSNESTVVKVSGETSPPALYWWLESAPDGAAAPPEPPKHGERVLLMLLSKDERENMIGDLAEEFAKIADKHGARFAKVWYWRQVVESTWPLLKRALRWGLLAYAWDLIRRLI